MCPCWLQTCSPPPASAPPVAGVRGVCHQAQFCFVFLMVVSLPQLKLNKTKEKLPSLKHYFIVKIFLGVVIVKQGKVFMLGKLYNDLALLRLNFPDQKVTL